MRPWEYWAFGTLQALLALTGFVYFGMKQLLETDDPFAVVNHPLQPLTLTLHVVLAPAGLVAFGIVLRSHILGRLAANGPAGRRSGWTALVSFVVMAGSGYLLQVLTDPAWLRVGMVIHVTMGSVFVLGYSAHLVLAWRGRRAIRSGRAYPGLSGSPSPP